MDTYINIKSGNIGGLFLCLYLCFVESCLFVFCGYNAVDKYLCALMNASVRLNNNNESSASISVNDRPLYFKFVFFALPNSGRLSVYEPVIGFSSSCGNAYFM
eukprot:795649_1